MKIKDYWIVFNLSKRYLGGWTIGKSLFIPVIKSKMEIDMFNYLNEISWQFK